VKPVLRSGLVKNPSAGDQGPDKRPSQMAMKALPRIVAVGMERGVSEENKIWYVIVDRELEEEAEQSKMTIRESKEKNLPVKKLALVHKA